jgi:dolichol-phosphate mannosyltransferase
LEGKQGSAFRAGINEALQEGYEGIITVDGNNKDNMSAIINFIEKLEDGYDFIQGSRYIQGGKHENTPLIRILATKYILTPWINILAKYKYTETSSAFRGYSKKILTSANLFRKCFVSYEFLWYMSVFAAKNNFKIIEIPTERIYPKGIKATKINVLGYFQIIFQLICLTFKKYN